MTTILFIRHGETAWNVDKRIQGHLDIPLNALGHAQALAVRDALAAQPVAAVCSSPLQRARDTARPIAEHLGLPVHQIQALAERHFGLLQGQSFESMREHNLEAAHAWARRDPHYTPEGGESLSRFYARVEEAVAALTEVASALPESSDDTVVLAFTHGGVLDMVYRMAQGIGLAEPRAWGIPNGGLNRLRLSEGARLELLDWADVRHLQHLTAGAAPADHRPI